MNDQDVINAFVTYLRKAGFPDLKVDRWPDKENRKTSDIDAIAGCFAIEHTSIDTLPNQRRDSDWFIQAVGGIEKELPALLPFHLNITIEYDAVTKGQDWAAIRQNLKAWIINESPRLDDGRSVLEKRKAWGSGLHIAQMPFYYFVKSVDATLLGVLILSNV